MAITKSSKLYLERKKRRGTHRGPTPRMAPGKSPLHQVGLLYPQPNVDFVNDGTPPPDRAEAIEPWPHGPPPES
jgi:hypothetical protein